MDRPCGKEKNPKRSCHGFIQVVKKYFWNSDYMLVIVLSAEVTAVRKIEKVSVPAVLVGRHSWQISTLANNISLDSGKDM